MSEAELLAKMHRSKAPENALERHLSNPRIQAMLDKIRDTAQVDLIVEVLEDMERSNIRLLQNASTHEELVSCREFSKCCGMLIRKLKRANKIKKDQNKKSQEMATMLMGNKGVQ